jgi:hypothetical protein
MRLVVLASFGLSVVGPRGCEDFDSFGHGHGGKGGGGSCEAAHCAPLQCDRKDAHRAAGECCWKCDGPDAGPPPVTLTGTWYTQIKGEGNMNLPGVSTTVDLEHIIRIDVTNDASNYTFTAQLCKASTILTPDPNALVLFYPPAVMALLKSSSTRPFEDYAVGDTLALPDVTLRAGSTKFCTGGLVPELGGLDCDEEDVIDADNDGKLGITLPETLSAGNPDEVRLAMYASLTMSFSVANATLVDANTIASDASFTTYGEAIRLNVTPIPGGPISILPNQPTVPITLKREAGVTTCEQINAKFP